ncbi:MAG: HD domain-containing protein [Ruminococcus sp.]|nr:HD domain-containing protein [Ruminococcus sp.]
MIQLFYCGTLAASLICAVIYIFMWHRHFDVNFTMIFTLVPIACLGYFLSTLAGSLGEALFAVRITYAGGGDSFYSKVSFEMREQCGVLIKEYGPAHTVVYASFFVFFAIGITAVVYSWLKKKQVPRTVLGLLVLPYVICLLSYFLIRKIVPQVEFVPLGYVIAEIIFLIIAYRVNLYDVSDTVIDPMVKEQGIGYVSFDFKSRYLGSNETAKELVPELRETAVDELFGYKPTQRKIRHFIDSFKALPENNTFLYTVKGEDGSERIFSTKVNYLYDNDRKRGCIVTFTDDTANQKYIRLLDTYNEDLRHEVEAKTRHIVEMHDNLIMSLAMMVESRDDSTGGHVKRTSESVRILVEEITRSGAMELSEEFCRDVIKAAPMHDLGKINVDDAVLRKSGRSTDEEYEKMKHHAEEGARVIHKILLHTDDESFKVVAENVAHYHHER